MIGITSNHIVRTFAKVWKRKLPQPVTIAIDAAISACFLPEDFLSLRITLNPKKPARNIKILVSALTGSDQKLASTLSQ